MRICSILTEIDEVNNLFKMRKLKAVVLETLLPHCMRPYCLIGNRRGCFTRRALQAGRADGQAGRHASRRPKLSQLRSILAHTVQ